MPIYCMPISLLYMAWKRTLSLFYLKYWQIRMSEAKKLGGGKLQIAFFWKMHASSIVHNFITQLSCTLYINLYTTTLFLKVGGKPYTMPPHHHHHYHHHHHHATTTTTPPPPPLSKVRAPPVPTSLRRNAQAGRWNVGTISFLGSAGGKLATTPGILHIERQGAGNQK